MAYPQTRVFDPIRFSANFVIPGEAVDLEVDTTAAGVLATMPNVRYSFYNHFYKVNAGVNPITISPPQGWTTPSGLNVPFVLPGSNLAGIGSWGVLFDAVRKEVRLVFEGPSGGGGNNIAPEFVFRPGVVDNAALGIFGTWASLMAATALFRAQLVPYVITVDLTVVNLDFQLPPGAYALGRVTMRGVGLAGAPLALTMDATTTLTFGGATANELFLDNFLRLKEVGVGPLGSIQIAPTGGFPFVIHMAFGSNITSDSPGGLISIADTAGLVLVMTEGARVGSGAGPCIVGPAVGSGALEVIGFDDSAVDQDTLAQNLVVGLGKMDMTTDLQQTQAGLLPAVPQFTQGRYSWPLTAFGADAIPVAAGTYFLAVNGNRKTANMLMTAGIPTAVNFPLSAPLAANSGGNAFLGLLNPAMPATLIVNFGAGWDGGNVQVSGFDQFGRARSEIFVPAVGDVSGTVPFATILAASKAAVGVSAAVATIEGGRRIAIAGQIISAVGVQEIINNNAGGPDVFDGTPPITVDLVENTIEPASPPDGISTYRFMVGITDNVWVDSPYREGQSFGGVLRVLLASTLYADQAGVGMATFEILVNGILAPGMTSLVNLANLVTNPQFINGTVGVVLKPGDVVTARISHAGIATSPVGLHWTIEAA